MWVAGNFPTTVDVDWLEEGGGIVGHAHPPAYRFNAGQKMIYWGPLKPLEKFLLRTAIAPWSYAASRLYHDVYWYPCVGSGRVEDALKTKWGKLFQTY